MLDPEHPLARLLRRDSRYKLDAYAFVFDALEYAHNSLGLGTKATPEEVEDDESEEAPAPAAKSSRTPAERHLTGQELCEAIRQYALDQYGYLAKCVLNSWGVHKTGDFGDIVYNLIRIGRMRKTKSDRREHFDDVYDFDEAFTRGFKFTLPKQNG